MAFDRAGCIRRSGAKQVDRSRRLDEVRIACARSVTTSPAVC